MEKITKIIIFFLIGMFIGSAITFSIFYFKTQNYRTTITRLEDESRELEERLGNVQGQLNRVKKGLGEIQEEARKLSAEIERTTNTIGNVSGDIESVIRGLERSIVVVEKLTEFLGYLERIFTEFRIEAPTG